MGAAAELETDHKTILIVEDEGPLRTLLRLILTQHGYRVLVAEDGLAAFRIVGEHAGPIHLLVTNVFLPKMDGYELAHRLKTSHPEMRTLYISGYLEGHLVARCQSDPGCWFLQKPFSASELVSAAGEALRGGRVAGRGAL